MGPMRAPLSNSNILFEVGKLVDVRPDHGGGPETSRLRPGAVLTAPGDGAGPLIGDVAGANHLEPPALPFCRYRQALTGRRYARRRRSL